MYSVKLVLAAVLIAALVPLVLSERTAITTVTNGSAASFPPNSYGYDSIPFSCTSFNKPIVIDIYLGVGDVAIKVGDAGMLYLEADRNIFGSNFHLVQTTVEEKEYVRITFSQLGSLTGDVRVGGYINIPNTCNYKGIYHTGMPDALVDLDGVAQLSSPAYYIYNGPSSKRLHAASYSQNGSDVTHIADASFDLTDNGACISSMVNMSKLTISGAMGASAIKFSSEAAEAGCKNCGISELMLSVDRASVQAGAVPVNNASLTLHENGEAFVQIYPIRGLQVDGYLLPNNRIEVLRTENNVHLELPSPTSSQYQLVEVQSAPQVPRCYTLPSSLKARLARVHIVQYGAVSAYRSFEYLEQAGDEDSDSIDAYTELLLVTVPIVTVLLCGAVAALIVGVVRAARKSNSRRSELNVSTMVSRDESSAARLITPVQSQAHAPLDV
mmetsp:Transcript_49303/g.127143  ORF Transcript_49303/g.127143 Transcript_49303/m.127143 type:complete len:441 (-) Transcript_49303:168-1490(-)